MVDLRTDFPQLNTRMVNPDGTVTESWYLFLLQLFRRTGGTVPGDVTPDQIIETAFSQTQLYSPFIQPQIALSGELTQALPVSACPMPEITFPQNDTIRALDDIVYAPQPIEMPSQVISVSASGSPYTVVASRRQGLSVEGGTITGITLARGSWSRNLAATTQLIEMNTGDVVVITYTAAPTITLLPR